MVLRIHYKHYPEGKAPYLFVAHPHDNELFSSGDFSLLPALSHVSYEEFLVTYNDVIEKMWQKNNGNLAFRFLPFSLRNTWQSPYYYGAESYARLSCLRDGEIYFTSPHWYLWVLSHMNCDANPEEVALARKEARRSCFTRLFSKIRGVYFALSHFSPSQPIPSGKRICFFSVWTKNGIRKMENTSIDPFYANLPWDIDGALLVYHLEGGAKSVILNNKGLPIRQDTSFMRKRDWFALICQILLFRSRIPSGLASPRGAILDDLAYGISNQMVLALISYYTARNIAAAYPGIKFITLYEGNCWEQGVLHAANEFQSPVIALQHTAFSPGMLKMRGDTLGLLPAAVITSGPAASELLTHRMAHEPEKIYTYGRIRHGEGRVEAKSAQGRKILVLLQGSPADGILVSQLRKVVLAHEIVVRCHPGQIFKELSGFEIAGGSLGDSLENAAVVLYNGTTAAFEALACGVPCVYISSGDEGRYDPLFDFNNAIKRNCRDVAELPALLDEVMGLSSVTREEGFKEARVYIDDYFHSPSAQNHAHLIEYLNND